jgi:hypothetical protein
MSEHREPTDSIFIKWGRLQIGILGRPALHLAAITIAIVFLSGAVKLW